MITKNNLNVDISDEVSFAHPIYGSKVEGTVEGILRDKQDLLNSNKNFAEIKIQEEGEIKKTYISLNGLTIIHKDESLRPKIFSELKNWPLKNKYTTLANSTSNSYIRGFISGIFQDFKNNILSIDLTTNSYIRVESEKIYKRIMTEFRKSVEECIYLIDGSKIKNKEFFFDTLSIRNSIVEPEFIRQVNQEINENKIKDVKDLFPESMRTIRVNIHGKTFNTNNTGPYTQQ